MPPLRIAFTGASGTGKTTLAERVSAKFDVPINPVGSRSVAKLMGFDNPYDVDKAGKRGEFQHRLVEAKREWEDTHESFVTDRTTLDNLAYTVLHDVYCINKELVQKVAEGLKRYTHVVFCPLEAFIRIGDDPHRVGGGKYQADSTYHELYELVLDGLLAKYTRFLSPGVTVLTLREADLEARCQAVERFVGGCY
jgi:predicted ATPase